MIDRKEIEKLMVKYAEERRLKSFWLHFHSNEEGENPFFSVYEDEEFLHFDEIEDKKEKTKFRVTVKIVDDEIAEPSIAKRPSVYLVDSTHELYMNALKDFERYEISTRWMINHLHEPETYKTKSIEKSIHRIVDGRSYKLIAFESYGMSEYEAKLH